MKWNIYLITSLGQSLNGVMLRGRIRKFGIENNFDILTDNTEDMPNGVRFALLSEDIDKTLPLIKEYLITKIADIIIQEEMISVINPILSKLKCNIESRYEL